MSSEMSETSTTEALQPVEFIPFNEFKNGLPFGRFRVIVNPKLAQKFMKDRLNVVPVSLILIILGLAVAFYGARWFGGAMVVIGVLINRLVKAQAPKMVLHLATRDAATYRELLDKEVMSVHRA
jgi:hypothetical protein